MAFWDKLFDTRLSYPYKGGPVFSTQKVVTIGGRRSVNRNWTYPLHRYDVSGAVRSEADYASIRKFFWNVAGAFDGFLFKDHHDYKVTQAEGVLTDLGGGAWQLWKQYVTETRTALRPITKPVESSVAVYDSGGTPLTATIDATNGHAAVSGTPAKWSGSFYVPVAFESDELSPEIISRDGDGFVVKWGGIVLEEIRIRLEP